MVEKTHKGHHLDMKTARMIGVIGGGDADPQSLENAYQVGKLVAEQKAILVCGGLGGVMEAACRGAHDAGGITVGILPSDDPSTANEYVSIPIATGMGQARNKLIINTGQAFIAIAGKYGTLAEIAFGLDAGKPVVGLGSWDIEGMVKAETPQQAVDLATQEI